MCFNKLITCAWIEASNALIGSSHTINLGFTARALAIPIRCLWPPENSAGYLRIWSGFKETISLLNNFVHPYNSSNNIKLTYGGDYTIGISINKAYSNDDIAAINEIVDKVIKEKLNNNMPTIEKIKIIHDYIIDNAEYDKLKYENKNDTTYKSNTAYGVLVQGYGTCNGYADAMAIFLDKLNIINYKISNSEHIWNLVYLDGKWYHLDLTLDDPISDVNINRDTYFLITTSELEELNDGTHKFDKSIYTEAK